MKKLLVFLLAACMLNSLTAAPAPDVPEVREAGGPGFTEMTDVGGIAGSCYYIYQPAEYYNPQPFLTPVIYVFPDKAYENRDAAWDALKETGLFDIAEEAKGVIVAVNPLGETYTKADLDVFEAVQADLYNAREESGTFSLTYHNLQYAIGEGNGATFINECLSQNCKRIAGVLTFGGEYDFAYQLYSLPAYIVSGDEEAVDFFKAVNAVDTEAAEDGKTIYYNAVNPVQKVIVSDAQAESLNAELIADCWQNLFRHTTRIALTTSSYDYPFPKYNNAEFTLLERPDYEAAGMDVKKHGGNPLWEDDENSYWFEFVPQGVKNAGEDERFPLIVVLHGAGDNPLFEAEFNGWTQLAIDHELLVVAPNAPLFFASETDTENIFGLIDYMSETYPVDPSRIYIVGFSLGSLNMYSAANLKPELFAAIAPMASPFYNPVSIDPQAYDYDIDLPVCLVSNQFDDHASDNGILTNSYKFPEYFYDFASLNEVEIYDGERDIEKYPYWGIPFEDTRRILNKTGFAHHVGFLYDEDGVPMIGSVYAEGLTHNHFPENAAVIWNWMQHFSRDTETGKSVYTP